MRKIDATYHRFSQLPDPDLSRYRIIHSLQHLVELLDGVDGVRMKELDEDSTAPRDGRHVGRVGHVSRNKMGKSEELGEGRDVLVREIISAHSKPNGGHRPSEAASFDCGLPATTDDRVTQFKLKCTLDNHLACKRGAGTLARRSGKRCRALVADGRW